MAFAPPQKAFRENRVRLPTFDCNGQLTASADRDPSLDEMKQVFEAVHQPALAELAERSEAELDVLAGRLHLAFKTNLAAVESCPQQELVHAGQIAMLRRPMGQPPLR